MKNILLYLITATFIIFPVSGLFSQNISNIELINTIADKDKATFSDGIQFFMLIADKKSGSFENNINALNNEGITKGITLEKESPLRRGTLALVLARYLNLNDSLFYIIFDTERYAYRACIADDIMSPDGSEWDTLSGGELIEIMTKVSELTGGN